MTRAEMEQVRAALADAYELGCRVAHFYPNDRAVWGDAWPEGWNNAIALIDAALAKPEAREWRLVDAAGSAASMNHQDYGYMQALLADHVAAGLEGYSIQVRRVEHVTPAGPWERAE